MATVFMRHGAVSDQGALRNKSTTQLYYQKAVSSVGAGMLVNLPLGLPGRAVGAWYANNAC